MGIRFIKDDCTYLFMFSLSYTGLCHVRYALYMGKNITSQLEKERIEIFNAFAEEHRELNCTNIEAE